MRMPAARRVCFSFPVREGISESSLWPEITGEVQFSGAKFQTLSGRGVGRGRGGIFQKY